MNMMPKTMLNFKKGSFYSRKDIGYICYPETGRPKGGDWDTGYTSPKGFKDNLLVFMNIGVPGKTGHNFDNKYFEETNLVQWFGKPGSHSGTPTFKRLLSKELTPHFFARWDTKNTKFLYLGIGSIIKYEDNSVTEFNKGTAIKCQVHIKDADEIFNYTLPNSDVGSTGNNIIKPQQKRKSLQKRRKKQQHIQCRIARTGQVPIATTAQIVIAILVLTMIPILIISATHIRNTMKKLTGNLCVVKLAVTK